jgi:hypothetical protein
MGNPDGHEESITFLFYEDLIQKSIGKGLKLLKNRGNLEAHRPTYVYENNTI